jgi:hypothetical protein
LEKWFWSPFMPPMAAVARVACHGGVLVTTVVWWAAVREAWRAWSSQSGRGCRGTDERERVSDWKRCERT